MFKIFNRVLGILFAVVLMLANTVFAGDFLEVSYLENDVDFRILSGLAQGGQYGANIYGADIDLNTDKEVIIGAPYASIGGELWNGLISILKDDGAEILIEGPFEKDYYGVSYCVGDINNDGNVDLAAAAYKNSRVDIYYSVDSYSGQGADLSILGEQGDDFGTYLVCGDYNGDDIDDVLVGAPSAKDSIDRITGDVYLYYGGVDKDFSDYDGVYYGQIEDSLFGSSFDIGDLDADGDMEIVIGAPGISTAYLIDGKSWLELKSPEEESLFGFEVEVGDLNADQVDDVVVSAFPYGARENGSVSVYYGAQVLDGSRDLYFEGVRNGGLMGSDVEIFDYTGDAQADLVIGAPNVNGSGDGGIYVVSGANPENGLSKTIFSLDGEDWFGYSIENIGGKLFIGARYADGESTSNNGKVFVISEGADIKYTERVKDSAVDYIVRSKAVSIVVEEFNLRERESDLIASCYEYKDFCFFNFMAMSSFDGIVLEPEIVLYPDIPTSHEYYEDVTVATMLGLVNGYLSEVDSPFHPDYPISRIQALKVVLGAGDIVPPKYKFELIDILGSLEELLNQKSYFIDVDPGIDHMWWYPRYVNFAVENGIVARGEYFRPDEPVTEQELRSMIKKTIEYINSADEEIES